MTSAESGRARGPSVVFTGLHMVPDPQRTPVSERGKRHQHQDDAVRLVRSAFAAVDARDWLAPAGLDVLRMSVGFVDNRGRDKVPPLDVGRRTPSRDLTVLMAFDHKESLTLSVRALAELVLRRTREGLDAVALHYGLPPFPHDEVRLPASG